MICPGAIAQLGERLPCTQEVSSSILLSSTIFDWLYWFYGKPPETPERKTEYFPLGSVSVQKRMFQSDEAFLSDHWSELLFNNVDKIETSERMNLVTMTQACGRVVL